MALEQKKLEDFEDGKIIGSNLPGYKMCSVSVMDTTDPDIQFDEEGRSHHYHSYHARLADRVFRGDEAKQKLESTLKRIKNAGANNDYDCIIGVSGGVDSTYVAYLTKQLGLRPLAVHFDNGWNSELAVSNIEKTLNTLGIDLYTHVIRWDEFKDLQLSFLKASTPDGEVPTDHAINALLFSEASKRGIRFVINGMNFATESWNVPHWAYGHSDWTYIKAVHRQFGTKKLSNFPHFSLAKLFYWTFIKKIQVVSILNYVEYDKNKAIEVLKSELDWRPYGGKHHESIYTRFYQGYILPKKFLIDKRKGHLSDLIFAGKLSREEAIQELRKPPYATDQILEDQEFFLKKFKLSQRDFQRIIEAPIKSFKDYPNNFERIQKVKRLVNWMRTKGYYSK